MDGGTAKKPGPVEDNYDAAGAAATRSLCVCVCLPVTIVTARLSGLLGLSPRHTSFLSGSRAIASRSPLLMCTINQPPGEAVGGELCQTSAHSLALATVERKV